MFGDISCSTAILAAQCKPMQQAEHQQSSRGSQTNTGIGRQETDQCSGTAHQNEGHEEGVLTSNNVSNSTEKKSAERTHHKADCKRREIRNQCKSFVTGWIKQWRDDRREAAENI